MLDEREDPEGMTEKVNDYHTDYQDNPQKIAFSNTGTEQNDLNDGMNTMGTQQFSKMQHNLMQESDAMGRNKLLAKSGTITVKKKVTMEDQKSSQQDYNKTIEHSKTGKLMDT